MKQSKKCTRCNCVKDIGEFKVKKNGEWSKLCVPCLTKHKDHSKRYYAKSKGETFKKPKLNSPIPTQIEIDFTKPIDLKRLANIRQVGEQEIRKILHLYGAYAGEPHFMRTRDIFHNFMPNRSFVLCKQIVDEFLEADRNGLNFEEELKSRKYRKDGKRVILEAKRSK